MLKLSIPLMSADLGAIMRLNIPLEIYGGSYYVIWSFNGLVVSLLGKVMTFGVALLFLAPAAADTLTCLYFKRNKTFGL